MSKEMDESQEIVAEAEKKEGIKSVKIRLILLLPKILFTILFTALFMFLTKVKMWDIFGTESKFSVSVMFGPVMSRFLNAYWGTAAIVLARIVGVAVNYYTIKTSSLENMLMGWLVFTPIIMAGIYFSKVFKGDRRLIAIPALSIALFLIHPIGRKVWYFSLFWIMPILIAAFKNSVDRVLKNSVIQVYAYSIGSTFSDHAIGSIMYLYLMNIPADAWIQALPFVLVERAVIAAGISFFYFLIKVSLMVMQRISALTVLSETTKQRVIEKTVDGVKVRKGGKGKPGNA